MTTRDRRFDAPIQEFRRGVSVRPAGTSAAPRSGVDQARLRRPHEAASARAIALPADVPGCTPGAAAATSFRPGQLISGPGGTDQRRQHSRGAFNHRPRLAGGATVEIPEARPGAAAASDPAAPRIGTGGNPASGVPRRGTVYRSGSREVRRGVEQRQRRRTAAWVTAGLVMVAAMPTAAIARPFWGPIASMVLFALALAGVGCLLLAVPARTPVHFVSPEDGGAR